MNWTKEEILEYNKRCAAICGWTNLNDDSFPEYIDKLGNFYSMKDLMFHSDWNWIMEVVEHIERKSEHIIIGRPLYNSFDIGSRSIQFYFSPDNKYLLQLELKQVLPDEPWIHTMYKHHIIKEFDFKTKGKKEAVVEAISQFLIWYDGNK